MFDRLAALPTLPVRNFFWKTAATCDISALCFCCMTATLSLGLMIKHCWSNIDFCFLRHFRRFGHVTKHCFASKNKLRLQRTFFEKVEKLLKQKMFEMQCFATCSNRQTFCLRSKFQMFDKQCLIVWQAWFSFVVFRRRLSQKRFCDHRTPSQTTKSTRKALIFHYSQTVCDGRRCCYKDKNFDVFIWKWQSAVVADSFRLSGMFCDINYLRQLQTKYYI